MNKTKIEYCDYTLNQMTGCLNHVNGICRGGNFPCYAYKLAHGRLKERYLANTLVPPDHFEGNSRLVNVVRGWALNDPFYPRFWPERFTVKGIPKGSKIFLNNMSDWVGIGIPEEWTQQVLNFIKANAGYTFLTLTKQPQNLPKWSLFPENCWVGVTATNKPQFNQAMKRLIDIKAKTKFISFEPLLEQIYVDPISFKGFYEYANMPNTLINGLIIGACTGTEAEMENLQNKYQSLSVMPYNKKWVAEPPIEWIQEIVEAADKAGIPIFLKDNLKPILPEEKPFYTFPWNNDPEAGITQLRQEFPDGR